MNGWWSGYATITRAIMYTHVSVNVFFVTTLPLPINSAGQFISKSYVTVVVFMYLVCNVLCVFRHCCHKIWNCLFTVHNYIALINKSRRNLNCLSLYYYLIIPHPHKQRLEVFVTNRTCIKSKQDKQLKQSYFVFSFILFCCTNSKLYRKG